MLNYLVIGLCLALLIAVIYFSIKPISMGIEARREINEIKINLEILRFLKSLSLQFFTNEYIYKNFKGLIINISGNIIIK